MVKLHEEVCGFLKNSYVELLANPVYNPYHFIPIAISVDKTFRRETERALLSVISNGRVVSSGVSSRPLRAEGRSSPDDVTSRQAPV